MAKKRINLALQGGGAHGAFTWGALDRLLEDDDIDIAAISATSAGALNAVALKAGLLAGGAQGARDNLDWLWEQVGAITDPGLEQWLALAGQGTEFWAAAISASPAFAALDATQRMLSPYVFGDAIRNPLERIVAQFNYDLACAADAPALFICATNVRSGKIRVFAGKNVTTGAILASACLPTVFKAVEITDPVTGTTEAYWDGGYSGNPALFPLFVPDLPSDILIVNINPLQRDDLPRTTQEIQNRINEISFNSSLLREMRAIEFVQRLIAQGAVPKGAMKQVLVHMVADDVLMNELNVATKMIPTPVILAGLKAAGRAAMDRFLADHTDDLGQRSTVDLVGMFG